MLGQLWEQTIQSAVRVFGKQIYYSQFHAVKRSGTELSTGYLVSIVYEEEPGAYKSPFSKSRSQFFHIPNDKISRRAPKSC